MSTATVNTVAGEVVSPATKKPKTYANDASFESVKGMVIKMAGKFMRRVEALSLPMSYDDVYQELCLSYVHAHKAWNPEGGAKFLTYYVYSAQNNFNKAIAKMERDRVEMGMTPIEDFAQSSPDGECDALDWMHGTYDEIQDPAYRHQSVKEIVNHSASKVRTLSKGGKKFIRAFYESNLGGNPMKLSEIAAKCDIQGDELQRLKVEIHKTFGVKWQN